MSARHHNTSSRESRDTSPLDVSGRTSSVSGDGRDETIVTCGGKKPDGGQVTVFTAPNERHWRAAKNRVRDRELDIEHRNGFKPVRNRRFRSGSRPEQSEVCTRPLGDIDQLGDERAGVAIGPMGGMAADAANSAYA